MFIDAHAPRLAGTIDEWTAKHLTHLLDCMSCDVFESPQSLRWAEGVVRHVLGPDADGKDSRAVVVARWLARQIGVGAFAQASRRSASNELRDEFRRAWRGLCEALPNAWLVEAPVDSQWAVAELAADGVFGDGLFPMPFGRHRSEAPPAPQLDQERLDNALYTLGQRLEVGGESKRLRRSRLLLADALLFRRNDRPIGKQLIALPLLRATRLPEDREEACSVAELRRRIENWQIFARPASEGTDYDSTQETQLERLSDPKRAVMELAAALDEAVWMVNGDTVARVAVDAPSPVPEALASAVLRTKALTDSAGRKPLLMRLTPKASDNPGVRNAARMLLAGRAASIAGEDAELFDNRSGNSRALHVLLRLLDRLWCAVPGMLVASLSQDTLETLGVRQADKFALHRLLDECLHKPVHWAGLDDGEAIRLLQDLHGADPEAQERWRRIPLHRGVDGVRGPFGDRARRTTGRKGESLLPPELEAEVRLLDPEPRVAHLYASVPEMNRDGLLRLMLEDAHPWRFAERIVHSVRPSERPVLLPEDDELRHLLRHSPWLPVRDGCGLRPDAVLVAPQELLDAVAGLTDAFGDKRLPEAVDASIWKMAEPVVREILRPGRQRQLQKIADALDSEQVGQVDHGAWLVMPSPDLVEASLVEDALQTTLAGSHPGWKIIHAASRVIGRRNDGSHDSSESLVKLAKALSAPIPTERQIQILASLAGSRPAKGSPGGRLFRRFLECFAEKDEFFTQVLSGLDLPTQDGNWHASRDVARSESGVARRHRLLPELRPILCLDSDDPVSSTTPPKSTWNGTGWDALENYFEPWRGRVPHGAVGAFLSLLGSGLDGVIARLAEQWLGEDVVIEPIEGFDQSAVSVFVSPMVAPGDLVSTMNVLGSRVEMEAEADENTLFAVDPHQYERLPPSSPLARLGAFWQVELRDVEPQSRNSSELVRLLGGTVERWAVRYLKLDREQVTNWWSRWGQGSQADFGPVLASIKAHLPLTLQQLDVKESEPLRDALREAERAQRKREQVPSEEALKHERKSLDRLADLILEPGHKEFIWRRVNELMRRYGYGQESVLLELAQNADDALAEAAEIKGDPLPLATRRLLVRVHEHDATPTVDVMHWGRPINDTGGATFPAGRERQWDQDLYFMMLMNLSGKPGEVSGESSPFSTTGRFGLGFKSVHLVSSSPSVVSGFLAFSISGGLLPQEQAVPEETDSSMIEGHRPTRVRLPLRPDMEARSLIDRLFHRFAYARVLLPVFARQIQEVVVEGGPLPGSHSFDGEPIDGAPGWSVGTEVDLPNHGGRWRILSFRPADAGREDMGTVALAIGLREGVPTAFGPDVPFLWNVTPTSEKWGCGYVVNGPFKLDPGRTHVSLDDDATLRTVARLGEALGRGLIELHDVLANPTDALFSPLVIRDGLGFMSSLWKVLVCGLNNDDALRRKVLLELHGNGRGLSAWMSARSAVPSDLPEPFQPSLPPLTSDVRIEVASGDFDSHVCAVLAAIEDEDFMALVDGRCVVSAEVEQLIRPLCNLTRTEGNSIAPIPLRPSNLFAELTERWEHYLTSEQLHSLRPIARTQDSNFDAYDPQGVTWRRALKARAADGSLQPIRSLLLRDAPDRFDHADTDGNDEFLRAAFAPDDRVLDPAYIKRSEDWRVFRWLRVQHRVDATMIAEWCADLPEGRHSAAIYYLLHGELRSSVLQHLEPLERRPRWPQQYDDVSRLVRDQCAESWRRKSFLVALFPDRYHEPESQRDRSRSESDTFFQQLLEWWDDDAVRSKVVTDYERNAWPDWLRRDGVAAGLRMDSEDHWLALLVLGACRSLGRAQDRQHRSFLELAYREGWWDIFKIPDDASAWMKVLRDWQDGASAKLAYPNWMALFPSIYQLSRYRDVYIRLLKSAGRRPEYMYEVTHLLKPRVDEALTGAGAHFDAPPAPLGMGLHWVLRELVRLEIVGGEHLFPDCWVPSEQVLRLLGALGLDQLDDGASNSQKARAIFDFLVSESGTDTPNLHLAFDIPLRRVDSDPELRYRFGLEQ